MQDKCSSRGTLKYQRLFWFFFKILFERENTHVHKRGGGGAEGEAGSPLSGEPNTGLNPRTPGP